MAGTILETIVQTKRREVEDAKRRCPLDDIRDAARRAAAPRNFYDAVSPPPRGPHGGIRLIAEIKKASPSAGLIRPSFDAIAIGEAYRSGGAAALSILTDREYFQGDLAYIHRVKTPVALPVLRKDFIVDAYQIYESRAAGSDAILLIAAILSPGQLAEWSRLAFDLGMTSLIEVHNESELTAASPLLGRTRQALLGINNRDLHAQKTDLDTTRRLAAMLPDGTPFVSESGIKTRDDAIRLQSLGATAMLVGESLLRQDDLLNATRTLLGADD